MAEISAPVRVIGQPVRALAPGRPAFEIRVRPRTGFIKDMEDGGAGTITGTVKIKGTPSNVPVARRVRLFKARDGRLIRETWSDPVTGAYSFFYLRSDRVYIVLSEDHTESFRAVVADRVAPT